VFLKSIKGEFAQLQESFESPEMEALSGEIAQKLKDLGVKRDLKAPERKKPFNHPDNWFPAGSLSRDSVIVVRTSALTKFLQSKLPDETERPVETRERNSLLTIIEALAQAAAIDVAKVGSSAKKIEQLAAQAGHTLSARAIENHLAKIRDR
jgi:hypothetical protein